jgi:uncharacterized protein (DUF2141 family)
MIAGGAMLKKYCLFLLLLIMGMGHLFAQTLTVRIENAIVGQGYLMVGVFNDERSFPDSYFRGERIPVTDKTMIVTFDNLPMGQYAVSVFQDNNGNGQLDTNIFGIPRERYGFSNDARRPDFQKSLFYFNDNMTIVIRIR